MEEIKEYKVTSSGKFSGHFHETARVTPFVNGNIKVIVSHGNFI